MTRRVYSETANSYSPYAAAVLQGLGAAAPAARGGWPAGRSYVGIAHFRAPYDEFGYFQDNSLEGLGHHMNSPIQSSYVPSGQGSMGSLDASEVSALDTQAPGAVKRFLLSGEPVPTLRSNITLPFNQVHPYVYGAIAVAALATSYVSYKRWKKTRGSAT